MRLRFLFVVLKPERPNHKR